MSRLIRWAARLYPPAWRNRYGAEFDALLADTGARGSDLWDILRGAFIMRITRLNFVTIALALTIAGALVAGVWSWTLPNRYTSVGSLHAEYAGSPWAPQSWWLTAQQNALSRGSLAEIMTRPSLNLYASDRTKKPLEDVVEQMRKQDIRIGPTGTAGPRRGIAMRVEFRYSDPAIAQATTRALIERLQHELAVSGTAEVFDPPSLPHTPSGPDRRSMIERGLLAGLLLGLFCGALWTLLQNRRRWSIGRLAAFGAAGMALALAIALSIPDRFISTAVVRSAKPPAPNLVNREHLHVRTVGAGPVTAYSISFEDRDRFRAQAVTREVISALIVSSRAEGTFAEVIDPASLPSAPSYPNRTIIVAIGLAGGLLLGLAASRFRRPAPAAA